MYLLKVFDDEDIEDLITLSGCGIITKWKFPKNKKSCPVIGCHHDFEKRSDAITHYKEQHAKKSVLCSICNKPICAQWKDHFIRHHKRMHPNIDVPFGWDDELITLSGCNQITEWKFPANLKRCPVIRCGLKFKKRSHAISHYKLQHAQKSILCLLCNKPISAQSTNDFIRHYIRIHPGTEIPYVFIEKMSTSLKKEMVVYEI